MNKPACAEAAAPSAGGGAAVLPTERWFGNPMTQLKRRDAIERELVNWKASVAGTYLDDSLRALVIVLHTDSSDYDRLRQKLEPISPPLKVVLRPACYPREEIEDARRVLMEVDWHPEAKSARLLWHFDAAFTRFSVGLQNVSPEVVRALDQRLGKLVETRLDTSPSPKRRGGI